MDLSNYQQPTRAKPTAGEPRTQREELLDKFLAKLNPDREKAGYPPLTFPRIARMLKGYDEHHLHLLYLECETGRSFGALLKWKLDQLKANKKV